jgi:hypothetical protein
VPYAQLGIDETNLDCSERKPFSEKKLILHSISARSKERKSPILSFMSSPIK